MGALLAGCSSNAVPGMSSLSGMFGSSRADTTAAAPAAGVAGQPQPPTDFECPSITIRQGASTYQIHANPADPSPMAMRYQVGIGETARECRLEGTTLTMRVGIQGRVVIGPQGGPGQIDVPIRLAVVREGANPRPITTTLHRVAVTIPQGNTNVAFTIVEEQLSFPMPPGGEIDAYVVYIGFDPLAARQAPPRRQDRRPPPQRGGHRQS